jgi:hypothetical protein
MTKTLCGALLLLALGGCGFPEPTPEQERLRRQMDMEQTMSQARSDSYQRAVAREQKRKQDWLAGKR